MFIYYFSAGILFFCLYFSLYALLYLHWVYSQMNLLNLLNLITKHAKLFYNIYKFLTMYRVISPVSPELQRQFRVTSSVVIYSYSSWFVNFQQLLSSSWADKKGGETIIIPINSGIIAAALVCSY